jgi:CheY-like chemotaxis protein
MAKKILWLDNDTAYIKVYVKTLIGQPEPYEVDLISTITEADDYLSRGSYDLLILDVMIPTTSEEEEKLYPPEETSQGLNMGLTFYIKHKKVLTEMGTKVLVLTARIDEAIKKGFMMSGLPQENIVMKAEVGDVTSLVEKVAEVLERR